MPRWKPPSVPPSSQSVVADYSFISRAICRSGVPFWNALSRTLAGIPYTGRGRRDKRRRGGRGGRRARSVQNYRQCKCLSVRLKRYRRNRYFVDALHNSHRAFTSCGDAVDRAHSPLDPQKHARPKPRVLESLEDCGVWYTKNHNRRALLESARVWAEAEVPDVRHSDPDRSDRRRPEP